MVLALMSILSMHALIKMIKRYAAILPIVFGEIINVWANNAGIFIVLIHLREVIEEEMMYSN